MSEAKQLEAEIAGYGTSPNFLDRIERQEYRAFDDAPCTNEFPCSQCTWAAQVTQEEIDA